MADVVDAPTRSRMMSGIRGKDTKPEILVRKALFKAGFRFRLHRRDLPGVPDVVLPGRKVAVFVHGCFWHMHAGCRYAKLPATRPDFWLEKLSGNVARDNAARQALREDGWRVLTVWECATRNEGVLAGLPDTLFRWINGPDESGEISGADMTR
jgi:DNA mismatch endonuclease (patch repair protein)